MKARISATVLRFVKGVPEKWNIHSPDVSYKRRQKCFDGDLPNEEIFRYFEEEKKVCTTVALNPLQYLSI